MKKHLSVLLTVLLSVSIILCATGCGDLAEYAKSTAESAGSTVIPVLVDIADANDDENKCIQYLGEQLSDAAEDSLRFGEDIPDCYSSVPAVKANEKFPEKYDLRDYDIITPVRSQSPWGTCWAFGTIAAAESSILSSMNITQTAYEEKYGEPMDLSEKHLAWFTANALPEESDYPEGEYPYDVSQAGEGSHSIDDSKSAYNFGGNYFLSTSVMASGIGPVSEKHVPYVDSNGNLDTDGDWSVDETRRFYSEYTLINANVLPAPAKIDRDGNYTYNEAGTNAIKAELLEGRAVGISFRADQSMPKETFADIIKNNVIAAQYMSEEDADKYSKVRTGVIDATEDELKKWISVRLTINDLDEDTYDLTGLDKDQLFKVLSSDIFGETLEEVLAYETNSYMSFPKDEEGNTIWAQYTNEPLGANHGVCAVGWDDSFPASYFPEECRPPADGAWILKNSWGTEWGMDGYFYLSYYDQTLYGCESFEFMPMNTDSMEILEKDFMPAECINSTLMDTPVYTSSILETEIDGVPQYLSVLTGDMDTQFTVSMYLLDDNARIPTDGMLLDSVTSSAHLAGYHRVKLSNNTYVPKGSRIGITVIERVETENGTKYALVNTSSLGERYVEYKNNDIPDYQIRFCKGIINSGESFISFGKDRWIDWKEIVDSFYAQGGNFDYIEYDNLPLKVFSYEIEDVTAMHNFTSKRDVPGGTAEMCEDCGYALTTLY